jgi:hypothetical protein
VTIIGRNTRGDASATITSECIRAAGAAGIGSVIIDGSVVLDDHAFAFSNLSNLLINGHLSKTGKNPFVNCTHLRAGSVKFSTPSSTSAYGIGGSGAFLFGPFEGVQQRQIVSYFARNDGANDISIPFGKTIGPDAFRGANISSLKLRLTTAIDESAFDGVEGGYEVHLTDPSLTNVKPGDGFCAALKNVSFRSYLSTNARVCNSNQEVASVERVAEETSGVTVIPNETVTNREVLWLKASEETELEGANGTVAFWQVTLEGTSFSTEKLEIAESLTMKGGVNLSVRSSLTFGSEVSEVNLVQSEAQLPLLELGVDAAPPSKVYIEVMSIPKGNDFLPLVRGNPFEECEEWRRIAASNLSLTVSNAFELLCQSESEQSKLAGGSRSLGLSKKREEEKKDSGLGAAGIAGIVVGIVAVVVAVIGVVVYLQRTKGKQEDEPDESDETEQEVA